MHLKAWRSLPSLCPLKLSESRMTTTYQSYINGEWLGASTWVPNINPSDLSDVVGEATSANESMVNDAIGAARHAFKSWSHSTPQQRFDILDAAGSKILERKEALGTLLAREEGKTLPEAIG